MDEDDVKDRIVWSQMECRFCHDTESQETMISPCKCAGSLAFVHKNCLDQWRRKGPITAANICPSCNDKYGPQWPFVPRWSYYTVPIAQFLIEIPILSGFLLLYLYAYALFACVFAFPVGYLAFLLFGHEGFTIVIGGFMGAGVFVYASEKTMKHRIRVHALVVMRMDFIKVHIDQCFTTGLLAH